MKMKNRDWMIVILIILLLSPLLSRCGRWKVVHTWESPSGTFGSQEPITLSAEKFSSFFDPLRLYQENRIVVSGGDYPYVVKVKFNFFDYVSTADVEWHENDVTFSVPSWISIKIPKQRILLLNKK